MTVLDASADAELSGAMRSLDGGICHMNAAIRPAPGSDAPLQRATALAAAIAMDIALFQR